MRKPKTRGCSLTAELPLGYGECERVGETAGLNGRGPSRSIPPETDATRKVRRVNGADVGSLLLGGASFETQLADFDSFNQKTAVSEIQLDDPAQGRLRVPVFTNEFWTAKQRQASSLHEISYRACFKPQLPRFFIERLSAPGEIVYDPFMGRGTTPIEAALLGRVPVGNDINPLSITMTRPRLQPPLLEDVARRLATIPMDRPGDMPEELTAFYHPDTLRSISSLKRYLLKRRLQGFDALDEWIAMVGLNRLTGHSNGFFSVYTLPPNQAVSVASQRKINERRAQTPVPRNVPALILKKTKQLLGDVSPETRSVLERSSGMAKFHTCDASRTPKIVTGSVSLVVTSPPFLNVVQYAADNWLRCWFLGINSKEVKLTLPSVVATWREMMTAVLRELCRVLRPGGHLAFEVGEVQKGSVRLDEIVLPAGRSAGLEPLLVLINAQEFTKTANCWGVDNMAKGTNTNRVVVFRKR